MLEFKLTCWLVSVPAIYFGLRFLWFSSLISSSKIKHADEYELRGGWRNGGYFAIYIGVLVCIYAPVTGRIPNETVSRLVGFVVILIGIYALWMSRRTILAMRVSTKAASYSYFNDYQQKESLRKMVEEQVKQSGPVKGDDQILIDRMNKLEEIDLKLSGFDRKIYISAVIGGILFVTGIILWLIEIESGVSDPPSFKEHSAVALFILGIILFLPLLFASLRALFFTNNPSN